MDCNAKNCRNCLVTISNPLDRDHFQHSSYFAKLLFIQEAISDCSGLIETSFRQNRFTFHKFNDNNGGAGLAWRPRPVESGFVEQQSI